MREEEDGFGTSSCYELRVYGHPCEALKEAEGEIQLLRWRAEAAEKAWAEADVALRLVVERYEEAQAALAGIFPRLSAKGEPPPEIKAAYEALAQRPA